MFSFSSVLFTLCCFELSRCSVEASFDSFACFAFKRVFTARGESCSASSASGTLCNVRTLRVIFGSSRVIISFSDENERRIFISLFPLLIMDVFPASFEFDVDLNMLESSAIVLNVPAGSIPHCIMGNDCNAAFTLHGKIRKQVSLLKILFVRLVAYVIIINKYIKCVYSCGHESQVCR